MKIVFTGGGTGGHFFPNLAVIRELKRIAEEEKILDLEFFYMGPDDFGKEILKEERAVFIQIASGKMRRYFSLKNFSDIFKAGWGIWRAIWNMFLILPDVVFSKGGYGALPAVIASVIFRIPLIIHESDAIPGKVNLFSSRFAKKIGVAFASAFDFFPKEKTALVGVPIRKRILGGEKAQSKDRLQIFSNLPVLGFLGASQGSQKINDLVLSALKDLTDEFEVIHQTGAVNFEDINLQSKIILETAHKENYHPFGFLDEFQIRDFYQASNIVISRASATSIFEIAAWGKPSILIPLENSAQDHQRKNAYEYARNGGAVVIEEGNLAPHLIISEIKKILGDPARMKKMGESAQKFSRIDSAEVIAREILRLGIH